MILLEDVYKKVVTFLNKGKLDTSYLQTWATKLCDEAHDMRIWTTLNNLLKN